MTYCQNLTTNSSYQRLGTPLGNLGGGWGRQHWHGPQLRQRCSQPLQEQPGLCQSAATSQSGHWVGTTPPPPPPPGCMAEMVCT